MSGQPYDDESIDDRLGDLAAAIAAARADGAPIDPPEFAARFQVSETEVQGCLAAVDLMLHAGSLDRDLWHGFVTYGWEEEAQFDAPDLGGDYQVGEEIGRGGMGIVYRAHQNRLGRDVAVKVLRPGELVFGRSLRRFEQEARALAKLRHPNIVSIHEVGESEGCVWFTMDLIEGVNLAQLIRAGEVTPSRALQILRQVASATAFIHRHGFIHRDLKPQNVLIDQAGDAFVTDFGLARETGPQDASLTQSGQVLGTPAYMSPEQARGDHAAVGEATDVYALGAILYECLAGDPPFRRPSPAETLHAVIHDQPKPPTRSNRRCPRDLEVIALKALEKDPQRRYGTVRAFLEDLERFEEGRPIRAQPPSSWAFATSFLRRHRWSSAGTLIVGTVLALLFVLIVRPSIQRQRDLELADRLFDKQRFEAAAELYEGVATEVSDSLVPQVLERLTRCLTAEGPALRAEIDARVLRARLRRVLEVVAEARLSDALRAKLEQVLLSELVLADAVVMDRIDERMLARLESISQATGVTGADGAPGDPYRWMLRVFEPILLDRSDPAQPVLMRWFLRGGSGSGLRLKSVEAWLHWGRGAQVERLEVLVRGKEFKPTLDNPSGGFSRIEARRWEQMFRSVGVRTAPARLAEIAADGDATEGQRRLAAWALARLVGLPLPPQSSFSGRLALPAMEQATAILERWKAQEGATRVQALEEMVRAAIAMEGTERWLRAWAGWRVPARWKQADFSTRLKWWHEASAGNVQALLLAASDLPTLPSSPIEQRALLDGFEELRLTKRRAIHALLWSLQPPRERWVLAPEQGPDAETGRAWRRVLDQRMNGQRYDQPLAAAVDWFMLKEGRWQAVPGQSQVTAIRLDEELAFRCRVDARELAPVHFDGTRFGLHPYRPQQRPDALRQTEFRVAMMREEEGSRLHIFDIHREVKAGTTEFVSGGFAPRELPLGRVCAPVPHSPHVPKPSMIALMKVAPVSELPASQDWEDWKAVLLSDFRDLADRIIAAPEPEARHLVTTEFAWLLNSLMLFASAPMPEALPTLRRLQARFDGWESTAYFADALRFARLTAEDPDLLGEDLEATLDRLELSQAASTVGGWNGYLMHLVEVTSSPELEAEVLARLGKTPLADWESAQLWRGIVFGDIPVRDWTPDPPAWQSSPRPGLWMMLLRHPLESLFITFGAGVLGVALWLMITARDGTRRRMGLSLLIPAGLVLVVVTLDLGEGDVLPASAGLIVIALSTRLLEGGAGGRSGHFTSRCFAAAALATFGYQAGLFEIVGWLATTLLGIGLVSLIRLGVVLTASEAEPWHLEKRALRPFPALIILVALAVLGLFLDEPGFRWIATLAAFIWMTLLLTSRQRVTEVKLGRRRLQSLPRGFLAIFAVPLAWIQATQLHRIVHGLEADVDIASGGTTFLAVAVAIGALGAAFWPCHCLYQWMIHTRAGAPAGDAAAS